MNTKPEVVISAKNRETLRGRALVDFVEQELARGLAKFGLRRLKLATTSGSALWGWRPNVIFGS